jgi:hypothetical protein
MDSYLTFFKNNNKIHYDKIRKAEHHYFFNGENISVINDVYNINRKIICDTSSCGCRINSFVWKSKRKKAIWYEIPKSASRSIVDALDIQVPNLKILFKKLLEFENFEFTLSFKSEQYSLIKYYLKRIKLYNLIGYSIFDKENYELSFDKTENKGYYSFAVIRNPYDRIISNYKMFTSHSNRIEKLKETFKIDSIKDLTFESFLSNSLIYSNHHWEPQVNFLPDDLDYISKFTTLSLLSQDWNEISNMIGCPNILLELNSTKNSSSDYNKYLNEDSFIKIRSKYKKDIDLYNKITNEDISNNVGRQLS